MKIWFVPSGDGEEGSSFVVLDERVEHHSRRRPRELPRRDGGLIHEDQEADQVCSLPVIADVALLMSMGSRPTAGRCKCSSIDKPLKRKDLAAERCKRYSRSPARAARDPV